MMEQYIEEKITTDRMIFFKLNEKTTMFGDWIEQEGLLYSSYPLGVYKFGRTASYNYRNSAYWDNTDNEWYGL